MDDGCHKKIYNFFIVLGPVDGDYWILDTDYENYSIVYSCVDYIFGLIHFGLYISIDIKL